MSKEPHISWQFNKSDFADIKFETSPDCALPSRKKLEKEMVYAGRQKRQLRAGCRKSYETRHLEEGLPATTSICLSPTGANANRPGAITQLRFFTALHFATSQRQWWSNESSRYFSDRNLQFKMSNCFYTTKNWAKLNSAFAGHRTRSMFQDELRHGRFDLASLKIQTITEIYLRGL